ncbi:MAG: FAD-binding oxidoreductase [Paracoccaceae bacterium]|nr:FAD-binding oxidoreductase [Paracoccaceae bacterium]MDG1739202.1 FAD-binding oxidoreductase [Paracoccaceae bacterium]MDG2258050.1 FAD-binding oxidoreductase [Paracoccaceae bacterium]
MTDILIIGGGIAGLSVGAALAPHASVTLLEAEDALAYHASGRSMALYEANYGSDTTTALARASGDFFIRDTDYLSPRGLMVIAKQGEEDAFARDAIKMNLQSITIDEALAKVPILNRKVVTNAAFQPDAWDIDTDRLMQDHARTIRANGGRIVCKASATKIRFEGRWIVSTQTEDFEVDLIVNAAGAWVDEVTKLAGVAPLGFIPCRRSVARVPAPGGHDTAPWPMFFGVNEGWYAKPDAGSLCISPADEHPTTPHDAWADDMVLAQGISDYQDVVTEEVTRVQSNWAGLRTFSPDRHLVIGHAPDNSAFFWLAGQGGYGFFTSPAASKLAADLILGRASELDKSTITRLSPNRFSS